MPDSDSPTVRASLRSITVAGLGTTRGLHILFRTRSVNGHLLRDKNVLKRRGTTDVGRLTLWCEAFFMSCLLLQHGRNAPLVH